jgi:hypothetical protein
VHEHRLTKNGRGRRGKMMARDLESTWHSTMEIVFPRILLDGSICSMLLLSAR